ncbi:MAG: protein kinase [Planctomycetota bacterium]|nr:protein kinase [Planctomycetota bacterium]
MSESPRVPCTNCRRPLPPVVDPSTRYVDCPGCATRNDLASGATLVGGCDRPGAAAPEGLGAGNADSPNADAAADLTGRLLGGRYQLDALIGRGGMGSVYRGTQVRLHRTVAVKLLGSHLLRDRLFVERFRREAEILATFDHPHIVQVIDTDVDAESNSHYIVMHYVGGSDGRSRSLKELLEQGPIDVRQALRILIQACSALQYAHAKGIIHRDIKPGNILIDAEGNARLADFGIASTRGGGDSSLTLAGESMGTPDYMSPEQRADPTKVTPQSDIYSLGVILYEMLTGVLPRNERSPQPSRVRDGVDPRLDKIASDAIQRDPAKRTASADAMRQRIEEVAGTSAGVPRPEAPEAPGVPQPPKAPRPVAPPTGGITEGTPRPRVGLMVFGGVVVLGALIAAGVAWQWQANRPVSTRSLVENTAAPATPQVGSSTPTQTPTPTPAPSPATAPHAEPAPAASPDIAVAITRGNEPGVNLSVRTKPAPSPAPAPPAPTPVPAPKEPAASPATVPAPAPSAEPVAADLLAAIDKGDDAEVRRILVARPSLAGAAGSDGSTPMHRAAAKGRTLSIAMLVAVGADLNTARRDGDRPLHVATREIQADAVKELLRRGANPRLAGAKGQSSEKIAAESYAGQEIIDLIRRPSLAGPPTPLPSMTPKSGAPSGG